MAKFTGLDKAAAARLREAVRSLEAMIANGATTSGGVSSVLITRLIDEDRTRIADLEQLETASVVEEHEKSLKELACAIIAQREAALTAAEQQQYAEFLNEEFFDRADFPKLEEFYRSAWDRLSNEGKAEMSHRFWEGVRREEYKFNELPEIVKEKEAQRLYEVLNTEKSVDTDLRKIPQADREDFLREWGAGHHAESYEILDRPSFCRHVALSAKATPAESISATKVTAAAIAKHELEVPIGGKNTEPSRQNADYDLGDLKLVATDDPKISPPLAANLKAPSTKEHSH